MTFSPSARKCRICHRKRRLALDTLTCRECLGMRIPRPLSDESPDVLDPALWQPNGRGTVSYVGDTTPRGPQTRDTAGRFAS